MDGDILCLELGEASDDALGCELGNMDGGVI